MIPSSLSEQSNAAADQRQASEAKNEQGLSIVGADEPEKNGNQNDDKLNPASAMAETKSDSFKGNIHGLT